MSMYKKVYADMLAVKAIVEEHVEDGYCCRQPGEAAILAAAREHGLPWTIDYTPSPSGGGAEHRTIFAGGKAFLRICNWKGVVTVTLVEDQLDLQDNEAFGLYLLSRTYELLLRLDFNPRKEQLRLLSIAHGKQLLMAEVLESMKD